MLSKSISKTNNDLKNNNSHSRGTGGETMEAQAYISIDGKSLPISGERNLLELIRKAGIVIPTFCYHSELSVYGACRLCLVDIEGRGLVTSCSTIPEPGMVVRTNTGEIRELRKITVELLLAGHESNCTTCLRSDTCKLRELASGLGIRTVRFTNRDRIRHPVDTSSHSLVRDPNKCILCGDCVRYCSEIQGIGAIDFVNRGVDAAVVPAFGKELAKVECVNCGGCAAVCPTAAIVPKSETDAVWRALADHRKQMVAQVAPAVRVAIGESFGLEAGTQSTGQLVAALKRLGFDEVYDTAFAADLTVVEEGTELKGRIERGEGLPLFTSCCPAWVKYAEQYYPGLLPNLSSCRSPQQAFGALLKDHYGEQHHKARGDVTVVSIMPCTAKKYEARRPEFGREGVQDVDHVLTTQELAEMIKEAGIVFADLEPAPFDMPFGFATGSGLIFGSSGGVTQAVLRFLGEDGEGSAGKVGSRRAWLHGGHGNPDGGSHPVEPLTFRTVNLDELGVAAVGAHGVNGRDGESLGSIGGCGSGGGSGGCGGHGQAGQQAGGSGSGCHHLGGVRTQDRKGMHGTNGSNDRAPNGYHRDAVKVAEVVVAGQHLKLAVVHGLKAAGRVAQSVVDGTCPFDVIEVMACPGGCVGGAGQPISHDTDNRELRRQGLALADKVMPMSKAQDNPAIAKLYSQNLGEPNGHKAHDLLHTGYQSKKRVYEDQLTIVPSGEEDAIKVKVCVGTGCFLKGAQTLLQSLVARLDALDTRDCVEVEATFCMEKCDKGPSVTVGDQRLLNATLEGVEEVIQQKLANRK